MTVILGHGGHAEAVLDLARACGLNAFRVPYEALTGEAPDGAHAIVGIGCGDIALRETLYSCLASMRLVAAPPLAGGLERSRQIGSGSVVFPGCVLGYGIYIARNAVIYSGCVVEHGSTVGDHAWLSPGVILCGNVTVKPRAFLGASAIVLPGVTIGEGARVGAGAVIHHDVPDGLTVYGPRDEGRPR